MTKQVVYIAILLCLLGGISEIQAFYQNKVEVRAAAFFPCSQRFREAYENVIPNYQIEVSGNLCSCTPFEVWTNFDWYSKSKKKNHCCKTRISLPNISCGIKYTFCFLENWDAYLGIGAVYGKVSLHNKTCCESEKISKDAFGGVLKSGVCYFFYESFFVDLFADYFYQPVHFHHKNPDVGGLKCGIGLGMGF